MFKERIYTLLRWSEKYTKTDMVYVGRSGFWLSLSQGVGSLSSLGLSILFAQVPKEIFGIYKYILSMTGLVSAFSLTGMNAAVTRAVSQGREGAFKESISIQIRWVIPQFLTLLAGTIYYAINGNYQYSIAFAIIAICAPVSTIANTFSAYLQGKEDFKRTSLYAICSSIVYFVVLGVTIVYFPHLLALIAVYFVTTSGTNLYFCIKTFRRLSPNLKPLSKDDISFAKHVSIMNVLASAASQIDNIIVYQLLGPAQLAIYSFALLIPDRIRSVFNTITAAALPRLSKSNGGEQVSLMRKVVQLFGVSVVIIACYLGSAPLIFNLLFEGYETSIRLSQIYALSLLVIPAYITLPALFAQAQKKALYTISIGVPILKIVISYYAIISWGILGAIVAKILHQLLHLTFSLFFVFTKSNSHENTPHLQDTQA